MAKRADNIAEENAAKENCFYFSKILKFSIPYTGMGYTLFFVCRVSNKAAGVFLFALVSVLLRQARFNKRVFRGKTEEKIEIKFCTAAIAKSKHCVFASFWLSFVVFGTRLVRKPHPTRPKKIVQAKIFCAKSGSWSPLASFCTGSLPQGASKKQPPIILITFEVLSHTPPDSANFA